MSDRFSWESVEPEWMDYLDELTGLMKWVRGKEVILDPKDFAYGMDLFRRGVPFHLVERVVEDAARKWMESHPLFVDLGVCGITKLRWFRKAVEKEFNRYREAVGG